MSDLTLAPPAVEAAASELFRGCDRFEVFARAGTIVSVRRDSSGWWEQRVSREIGVACRAVARGGVGFAAAAGSSARTGREAARAALEGLAPGEDPLPPAEVLGVSEVPQVQAVAELASLDDFARTLVARVVARSASVSVLDVRAMGASSETIMLRSERFVATSRGAGVVVELLAAGPEGPARLLHFSARALEELDPEICAERAVETVLLTAAGTRPPCGFVDVVAGPAVAAELVAALARHMVTCRLEGWHHLSRAHVAPEWLLLDARAGEAGLMPQPFDGEGLPSRDVTLLADGHQHDVPLAWAASKALGAPSGGAARLSYRTLPVSAAANLVVHAQVPLPLPELLSRLGDGLYLVLPASPVRCSERHGRFAVSCGAVLVAGGKPVSGCPLVEVRGSFRRLLSALEACGGDTERFALTLAVTTPSLLLRRLEVN